MEKNIYIIRWYGPFVDMESAREWDKLNNIPCSLYFNGSVKNIEVVEN